MGGVQHELHLAFSNRIPPLFLKFFQKYFFLRVLLGIIDTHAPQAFLGLESLRLVGFMQLDILGNLSVFHF